MQISRHASQNGSGLYLDFSNPKPEQFSYMDIAQGLARECRFNGQTREHYSVAQHSVLASLLVPKEHALAALVHDGSEAFMRDIGTPLKLLLPDYRKIEREVQAVVHEFFGLPRELDPKEVAAVKHVDSRLVITERLQLMPPDNAVVPGMEATPYDFIIDPMPEKQALTYFLDRLVSIMDDRPFVKQLDLWSAQQQEWLSRQSEACDTVTQTLDGSSHNLARQRSRLAG